MNYFKNLNIGARLGAGFALLIVIAVAVVLLGLSRMAELNTSLQLIDHDRVPKVQKLADISDDVNLIARELRDALIFDDPAQQRAALDLSAKARESIGRQLEQLAPTVTTPEGRAQLAAVQTARAAYVPVQLALVDLIAKGQREEAKAMLTDKLRPVQLEYMKQLDGLRDRQIQQIHKAATDGGAKYSQALVLMLGLLAAMVAGSAAVGWFIARSITVPIAQAVKVAQTVAGGDLGSQIVVNSRDETGQLLHALKAMNDSLVTVVGTVRQGSDSIATGSAQIATGNADLSQRTEEQASNLQQTAASMEQLSATVKNNADTARQATQLASSASVAAAKGGVVVGQVVGTMEAITASSKRISDIIGVIDGIAFQTNILALNAAVEAARAGEQGRGFAVVASEVRSLAQRSAEAAKEIKVLINDSVVNVETGSQQVGEAGRTMDDIVAQVKRVNDLIAEISAATIEQTAGIGQVSDAVTQLDQVTQQNAALVEESAAAADSLSQQAAKLVAAVSVFTLGGEIRGHAAPAPAPRAVTPSFSVKPAAVKPAAPKASPKPAPRAMPKPSASKAAAPAAAGAAGDDWESF
ncbi:MAG: MCP four helix bundle domain-containing protein [Burkholderiaceae bacterium]|nr:MCP four helix bundle domain-containing protein [Burkholderiaceae bacterium]